MLSSILQQCNHKMASLTLQYVSPILHSIPLYLFQIHRKFTATTSDSIIIIIMNYYYYYIANFNKPLLLSCCSLDPQNLTLCFNSAQMFSYP